LKESRRCKSFPKFLV